MLKLQYFGHPMERANSLEKTLMLGKIVDRGRRGRQRTRWLDGITDSMNMSFSKLRRQWRTGKPGVLQSLDLQRIRHNLATKQKQHHQNTYRPKRSQIVTRHLCALAWPGFPEFSPAFVWHVRSWVESLLLGRESLGSNSEKHQNVHNVHLLQRSGAFCQPSVGLAKMFIHVLLWQPMENSEWTFCPTRCISNVEVSIQECLQEQLLW